MQVNLRMQVCVHLQCTLILGDLPLFIRQHVFPFLDICLQWHS